MDRRQTIMDTVESVLKAANTLARDRVYIDRTTSIEVDRSNDRPPMINIYFPTMSFKRDGGASSRWTETSAFALECWAVVSPGRASRVTGDPDRLQSAAMNALAQQAVNALMSSQTFMAMFSEPPNVELTFGMDRNSEKSVACALIKFDYIDKGQFPLTSDITYDDLEQLWVDHELKGSPGATPDPQVISDHPDLQQNIPDLQE